MSKPLPSPPRPYLRAEHALRQAGAPDSLIEQIVGRPIHVRPPVAAVVSPLANEILSAAGVTGGRNLVAVTCPDDLTASLWQHDVRSVILVGADQTAACAEAWRLIQEVLPGVPSVELELNRDASVRLSLVTRPRRRVLIVGTGAAGVAQRLRHRLREVQVRVLPPAGAPSPSGVDVALILGGVSEETTREVSRVNPDALTVVVRRGVVGVDSLVRVMEMVVRRAG